MKLHYNSGAIEDSGYRVLATVDGTSFRCGLNAAQQEALGQQIVHRYNAHDELVAALRQIANGDGYYGAQAREYKEIARAALAKAGAL